VAQNGSLMFIYRALIRGEEKKKKKKSDQYDEAL
jgi:hypothetical protein